MRPIRVATSGQGRTAVEIVAAVAPPGSRPDVEKAKQIKGKLLSGTEWVGNGKFEGPKR